MKICKRCILDQTIPEIRFDVSGVCNYCKLHDLLEQVYPNGLKGRGIVKKIVSQIKKSGKNKTNDCIVGVSGGTDSSFTLYKAVRTGLRPLAVHLDNGWNSEIAVNNIRKLCKRLDVDLYTHVINWEEFKNLQISFLKASVPDVEVPTDVGIHALLIKTAQKEKVSYVLNGHSFRTEGIAPIGWTYMDGRYISSVQEKFGSLPLKTFPNITLKDFIYSNFIKRIRVIPFLNYLNYQKEIARKILEKEFGWQYYGGHHHESIYTSFVQSCFLPRKFGIDKRKTELSSMIRCGHIERQEALDVVSKTYHCDERLVEYIREKLGLNKKQFKTILNLQPKSFYDYRTYFPLIKRLALPIKILYRLNLIPKLLYLKYYTVFEN